MVYWTSLREVSYHFQTAYFFNLNLILGTGDICCRKATRATIG